MQWVFDDTLVLAHTATVLIVVTLNVAPSAPRVPRNSRVASDICNPSGADIRARAFRRLVMRKAIILTFGVLLVNVTSAFAYTPTGLPWDGPLTTLINGMQGGLAHAMLAGGIIVAGIGWTFWQEFGPAAKALLGVIAGGALAGAAFNIMTYLGLAAVIR